jgi:hypothetical protein
VFNLGNLLRDQARFRDAIELLTRCAHAQGAGLRLMYGRGVCG